MSQPTQRHTNRLLGYPDDARLLIVNARRLWHVPCRQRGDNALAHGRGGHVHDLMVPCAWALQAMQWLAAHRGRG